MNIDKAFELVMKMVKDSNLPHEITKTNYDETAVGPLDRDKWCRVQFVGNVSEAVELEWELLREHNITFDTGTWFLPENHIREWELDFSFNIKNGEENNVQ